MSRLIKNILLLGRPGSGKGTVAKKLLRDFNFVHLSTGDLLREQVRNSSVLGLNAKSYMDKGALVPDQIVLDIVKDYYTKLGKDGSPTLLDGFPRKLSQAKAMEVLDIPVDIVISLDIPSAVIVDRISKRYLHERSGRVYNLDYAPPKVPGKDDETGEPLIQRADDKPEVVIKRLEMFDIENNAIIDHYKQSKAVQFNSFTGTETDKIYPFILDWLSTFLQRRSK